jgi:Ca2+-binding RTX toxin-like protein
LESGLSRAQVLSGFTGSPQFSALADSFGIRAESRQGAVDQSAVLTGGLEDSDVLRAGAGNNILKEGPAAVNAVTPNSAEITGQVYRLYNATLDRSPDGNGFQGWFNGLAPGQGPTDVTLSQAAGGFVGSAEFQNTYGALSDAEFVTTLYRNVLDREPDARGLARWTGDLANGVSRADVVIGFSEGQEFRNSTTPELDSWIRLVKPEWNDVLEGGAGNDQMNGGIGSDTFVFRRGQGGTDVIHGFDPWDQLQLSGFGFATANDARAQMRQTGDAVIFQNSGQTITFNNTTMADMNRVRFNVS